MHFPYIKGTFFFTLLTNPSPVFLHGGTVQAAEIRSALKRTHARNNLKNFRNGWKICHSTLCDKIPNSKFNMTRKWIAVHIFLQTLGKSCVVTVFMEHGSHLWDSHWKAYSWAAQRLRRHCWWRNQNSVDDLEVRWSILYQYKQGPRALALS